VPPVVDIGSFRGPPLPLMVQKTVSRRGRATLLGGELWAASDLLIETRFKGKLDIQDHCLIIATREHVKAESAGHQRATPRTNRAGRARIGHVARFARSVQGEIGGTGLRSGNRPREHPVQ